MNTGSISAIVIVLQGESQLSVRKLSPQATTWWFMACSPVLNIRELKNHDEVHDDDVC